MLFLLYLISVEPLIINKSYSIPVMETLYIKKISRFKSWINYEMASRIKAKKGYDTLNVLALRVEFVEDDDTLTTGNGKMDMKGRGRPKDGLYFEPPHTKLYFERVMEFLKNYYYAASGGKLIINYTVKPDGFFDSYQMPHEIKFYGDTSDYNRGLVRLMEDALREADRDESIDFSEYDAVVIFHAGSCVQTDWANNGAGDSPFDIPAATVTSDALLYYLGREYIEVDEGRTRIYAASILPESPAQDGSSIKLNGVLVHEFGHILGLVDLYDVYYGKAGMGAWDLMGSGGWLGSPPGSLPSLPGAWDRVYLGWEDPVVVTRDTVIKLYAMERDSSRLHIGDSLHPTVVKIPLNNREYFLMEVRSEEVYKESDSVMTVVVNVENGVPVSVEHGEYDFMLPGSGVLIWHIDDDIVQQYAPFNSVNAYFLPHLGVDLEEADGIQDYEIPGYHADSYEASYGTKYDPFFKGGFNSSFTPETDPNSNSYYGKSGVYIEVLSEPDTVMEIKIRFEDVERGFPVKVATGVNFYDPIFYDVNSDGIDEILLPSDFGVYMIKKNGEYLVSGNPKPITVSDSLNYSISIGNVDEDSLTDLVLLDRKGNIYIYNFKDGHMLRKDGFPYALSEKTYSYPLLHDYDKDGIDEVFITTYTGKLLRVSLTDSVHVDSISTTSSFLNSPALFDDSTVVCLGSDNLLYMFDIKRMKVKDGYPMRIGEGSNFAKVTPMVVDYKGKREVVCMPGYNSGYSLVVVDSSIKFSSKLKNSPLTLPVISDVNGDGRYDVLFGSENRLYAFSEDGVLLQNFPLIEDETFYKQTIVEIFGYLYLLTVTLDYYFPTTPLVLDDEVIVGNPDWGVSIYPMDTSFSTYGTPLALGGSDIDNDGKFEIVAATDSGYVYLWEMEGSNLFYHNSDPANRGFIKFYYQGEIETPDRRLFVYPNPVGSRGGYIRFWTGNGGNYRISIHDITGKILDMEEVKTEPSRWKEIPIRIESYSPGVYIVRLEGEGVRIFYKFGVLK